MACKEMRREVDLLAINHWNIAIDTHVRNHPGARHLCESLDSVDPRKVVPGGRLDLLCASPECTHHSNARGGKPRSDQLRATAWHVVRWAEALRVENILVENVREFRSWGPLTKKGKVMKRKMGQTYQAFLNCLRSLDYSLEDRVVNAADFGDATTRKRLFIMASKRRVSWPEPSHAGRWRAAREIIDWSLKGVSIFGRKRPLAANTLKRIWAGFMQFGGEEFIVNMRGTEENHLKHPGRSVDEPLPTITAGGNHMALCKPFLVTLNHGGGEACRTHSMDQPVPTLTTRGNLALVDPFIIQTDQSGSNGSVRGVDEPIGTIVTKQNMGLVQFVVKYYGTGGARSVGIPLDTITTKDRFGLVVCERRGLYLDFLFRLLQPHELAAAMSFPAGYQFTGTREKQVRQIGNAVAVRTAAALCKALLEER
jgi:DNA (cytosine-5)-methyltransferase 1